MSSQEPSKESANSQILGINSLSRASNTSDGGGLAPMIPHSSSSTSTTTTTLPTTSSSTTDHTNAVSKIQSGDKTRSESATGKTSRNTTIEMEGNIGSSSGTRQTRPLHFQSTTTLQPPPGADTHLESGTTTTTLACPKIVSRSPSGCSVSPVRSRPRTVEPLMEEDSEVTGGSTGDLSFTGTRSTGRSGSAGTLTTPGISGTSGGGGASGTNEAGNAVGSAPTATNTSGAGGFPMKKRGSLHHGHGKKLSRRSSFLVDTACSSVPLSTFPKPQEPVPQPVVVQTRRCSLTLPYPNLYGSWQAAPLNPPPVVKSASNELATVATSHCTAGPPPLFKRRSVAQFDMSGVTSPSRSSEFPPAHFRRPMRPLSSQGLAPVPPGGIQATQTTQQAQQQHQHTLAAPTIPSASILPPSPEEEDEGGAEEEESNSGADDNVNNNDDPHSSYDPRNPDSSVIIDSNDIQVHVVPEPYLLAIHLQKVPMKDFGSEVRATLDVAHFLNQAVLLLDVNENSLEGVVDAMLIRLFRVAEEPHVTVAEVKSSLFAHDSVHLLARTIQGTTGSEGVSFDYDQSWICAICNLPVLQRRHVAIARLKHPANFGRTSHEVRLFILVLCPSKEKGTKNALETGRTFSTIFSDMEFRHCLLEAHTEEEFKRLIIKQAQNLSQQQSHSEQRVLDNHDAGPEYEYVKEKWCRFGTGIKEDLQRRLPHYTSDYRDGLVGYRTVHKTISTTLFLYFACILPAIAFGVLNDHTTRGLIDVKKVIVGQTLGELFYVILSGQPLNILLTTAPLCLFVKILYALAEDFQVDFEGLYCCVGLWSSLFTALYALLDVSRLMRWSTRSTEEIFALFISIAFCVDAMRDTVKNFQDNYNCKSDMNLNLTTLPHGLGGNDSEYMVSGGSWVRESLNATVPTAITLVNNTVEATPACHRDSSILFLLLMLGTLWLGVSLYNFNKTPYLQASKREALADYSLPVAVVVLSFIGSFVFQDVHLERFRYDTHNDVFKLASLSRMSWTAIMCSVGLGFSLSLLIFMDQNITSAMVNNPCNKLKKGPAYHWDLFVVSIINGFLSIFTMPWMHATLPHSPLHMRSLADVEERVDQGHVYEIIVRVRETRLTGICSHALIGLSIFLLPYPLGYIPIAVLDGLFLYMAVTALNGNQMFERITLLFMEQAAYPPNHYIRRVPQRKIHQFTGFQVLQLSVMCFVGFVPWPYVKMIFPITLLLLLPIRHKIVPLIIEQKFLDALDGEHQ